MLVVISPAKKLDFDNEKKISVSDYTIPTLLNHSSELIEKLRECTINDLTKLMNISYGLAEQNLERFISWKIPFTPKNSKPAIFAFDSEVYTGLKSSDFKDEDLKIAQKKLRILSGLYGVLRPLDLIQPYRLEMGTKLTNPRGKDLYQYWGDTITEELNNDIEKNRFTHLINLSSNEYFKSINTGKIKAKIITPVFKEKKGNTYRVISFYAKKARGLMTRFIITNNFKNIEDLKAFNSDNYHFDASQSTKEQFVFVR
jgi:cytoplasmic iron level regulating protein YaaA (DUF328/UPF0246 family)